MSQSSSTLIQQNIVKYCLFSFPNHCLKMKNILKQSAEESGYMEYYSNP